MHPKRGISFGWTQLSWQDLSGHETTANGAGAGGTFQGAITLTKATIGNSVGGDSFTGFGCVNFRIAGFAKAFPCATDASLAVSAGFVQGACGGETLAVQGLVRCESEPVNTATGAYETGGHDLLARGILPFDLTRRYSSSDPSTGIFGRGWSSILEMRLVAARATTFVGGGNSDHTCTGCIGLARKPKASGGLYIGDSHPPVPCYIVPEGIDATCSSSGARMISTLGVEDVTNASRPVAGRTVMLRSAGGSQFIFSPANGEYAAQSGVTSRLAALPAGGFEMTTHDQLTYRFDAAGRLEAVEDRNGNGFEIAYDGAYPSVITTSSGRTVSLTFANKRLVQAVTDDGRSVSYGYTDGELTSVTAPDGRTTGYGYEDGLLTQVRDAMGRTIVDNTYEDGRVVAQQDGKGETSTFDYSGALTTYTDARGNTWKDSYSGNVLIGTEDPEGGTIAYRRNADLDLTSMIDPRAKTWTIGYDEAHNPTSMTGPSGTGISMSATYTPRNDPATVTDGRLNTTTFDYQDGNLVSIDRPGAADTSFENDPDTGLPTTIIDPRLNETSLGYDERGQLVSVERELGRPTTFGYDAAGNLDSITEPRGNVPGADADDFTTRLVFDPIGRPTATIDPLGGRTSLVYDEVGNLCRTLDANATQALGVPAPGDCEDAGSVAGEQSLVTDVRGDLEQVTGADQGVTTFGYDEVRNLVQMTDANGRLSSFGYDAANRLIHEQSPITSRDVTYLPGGLPGALTDVTGEVTTFGYDNASRLTSIDYSMANTPDVSFEYDQNSNRTRMNDGAGHETYVYDDLNRVTEITRPGAGTIGYSYDEASNVTQRRYPDGREIDYDFDANDRLTSVSVGGETTTYDYDVAGRMIETAYPNGWKDTLDYDPAGRLDLLQTLEGADVLNSFDYARDAVGNPLQITEAGRMDRLWDGTGTDPFEPTPDETTSFGYDDAYRLTAACFDAACNDNPQDFVRYSYDQMGNRQTEERPGEVWNYSYNDADQLMAIDGPSAERTREFAYDERGNMILDSPATYTYDQAGSRLVEFDGLVREHVWSYDGDGKRLHDSLDGRQRPGGGRQHTETDFLWDPNFRLPMMIHSRADRSGDIDEADLLYGNGLISSTTDGAEVFTHPDGIGSISGLTQSDGTPVSRTAYEPFGEFRSLDQLGGAGTTRFAFAGEYEEQALGSYHLRARQYDPTIGRFLTPDPLNGEIETSTYGYAANRPSVFSDPSGLAWEEDGDFGLFDGLKALVSGWGSCLIHALACIDDLTRVVYGTIVPIAGGLAMIGGSVVICLGSGMLACAVSAPLLGGGGAAAVAGGVMATDAAIHDEEDPLFLYDENDWRVI